VVQQGADAHLRVDLDGPGAAFAPQLLAVLEATPAASVALSDIAGQVRIGNEYLENSPPVALDAEISTPRNTPRVGELPLGLDADADEVRFTLDAPAAHGTAEVTRSGLYRYTPDPGYTGADSFGYTVSDYRGSNTYTVEVTVEATNVAPVSADANVAATEDTVFAGALPAATDGDGDPVTYALAVQAAHGVAAVQPDGAFQYTPTADYFGPDAFQFSVSDGNGGSNTYTDGADTLVDASGGPSTVDARAGDDTITAGSGDDTIDGGAGIDTATYAGNRSGYDTPLVQGVRQVVAAAGNDGADALVRVERLQFADERRAIDVRLEPGTQDNNAGMTARILGVVFGTDAVAVPAYVGIGLQLLDGGLAYADLCGLAMAAAGATTPAAVVQLLWTNLLGTPPTAAEAQPFVDLLVRGDLSVGQLTALAADLDLNATRIDLAGLQQDGIAYA
jgi:hypothetical protein